MRAEVAAGSTLEQVLAANISAPYAADFPSGHERFVRLLYQELTRRQAASSRGDAEARRSPDLRASASPREN
jgi:hypothetical protein